MPSAKMSRPATESGEVIEVDDDFNFGEREIISVEVTPSNFLDFREPCGEELIKIADITDGKISEVEATLQIICILHVPRANGRKISLRDAKKLTSRQIKKIGAELGQLLGSDE